MILRNKETGVLGELSGVKKIVVYKKGTNKVLGEYATLSELTEDWEDYEPIEPLIKDEKIRKAVKAWAEANEIMGCKYYQNAGGCWFYWEDCKGRPGSNICFMRCYAGIKRDNYKKWLAIKELCAEQE